LQISRNVLYDKTLFKTAAITWTATNLDVDFSSKTTPMFIFKSTDLFGITPGDTLEIYQTGGTYDAANSMWYGKGGRTDFTRVGMDSSKVFTGLHNYKLNLEEGHLVADSARYYRHPCTVSYWIGHWPNRPEINRCIRSLIRTLKTSVNLVLDVVNTRVVLVCVAMKLFAKEATLPLPIWCFILKIAPC
jgi:hypothetical protein